jgi:multidrug transporter EmrE-like cation transporter
MGAFICSPMWLSGFILTVLLSFPFDIMSLMFIPQSVAAGMSAFTIVLNQIISPHLAGEPPLSRMDWCATLTIVCGVVLVTTFGNHCSREYSVDQMLVLWEDKLWIGIESTAPLLMLACFANIYYFIPAMNMSEEKKSKAVATTYSILAGVMGGQQNIFFKAGGEMLEKLLEGDDSSFFRWQGYVFMFMAIVCAVCQLQWINLGIKHWHISRTYPIYITCLILCSAFYGMMHYQEYKGLTTNGIILFPVAVLVVITGIVLLSLRTECGLEEDPRVHDENEPQPGDNGRRTSKKAFGGEDVEDTGGVQGTPTSAEVPCAEVQWGSQSAPVVLQKKAPPFKQARGGMDDIGASDEDLQRQLQAQDGQGSPR